MANNRRTLIATTSAARHVSGHDGTEHGPDAGDDANDEGWSGHGNGHGPRNGLGYGRHDAEVDSGGVRSTLLSRNNSR